MPQLLTLRGRHALSPFRVAKLQAALAASRPGHAVASIAAEYWHFVAVERALSQRRARNARSAADLRRPRCRCSRRRASSSSWCRGRARSRRGRRKRPTSRGTAGLPRSSASSGASASAWRRAAERPLSAADRAALLPLLHDRMTETVLPRLEEAGALFAHVPPRPLASIPCWPRAATRSSAPTWRSGSRWPRTRSTISTPVSGAGTQPDRRRADDVRAGELRALPAQDLQRATGSSTASRRTRACSR